MAYTCWLGSQRSFREVLTNKHRPSIFVGVKRKAQTLFWDSSKLMQKFVKPRVQYIVCCLISSYFRWLCLHDFLSFNAALKTNELYIKHGRQCQTFAAYICHFHQWGTHHLHFTLSDSAAPYSKCATPYAIGLWRKWKSCDQKHGCHSEIFLSTFCGFQDCNCTVSRYICTMWPVIFFYILYCTVSRYRTACIWAASRKNVPNVLSRCHTKRRMGTCGLAHPSFGMTQTYQILQYLKCESTERITHTHRHNWQQYLSHSFGR